MNRVFVWLSGVLTSAFMLVACGSEPSAPPPVAASATAPSASSATPRSTAAPSATFSPTAVLPSPTFIFTAARPGETPAAVATPDPNLGVGGVAYQDSLDGASGWDWTSFSDEAATFSLSGGKLNAVMIQPNLGSRFSVSPNTLRIGDQQLRITTLANLCYARDEYGVMFRVSADSLNNYFGYVFKINCAGQARVELLQNEQVTVLVDWTPSPAIVSGAPAENALMIWMANDQFHFYVNDKYLFSVWNDAYAEGFYGVYLRDRTNGGESISFENLVARKVTVP